MNHGRFHRWAAGLAAFLFSTVAFAASDWSVEIHQAKNFTGTKEARLKEIAALAERVLNSDEFRERVLNFKTKSKKNGRTVYTTSFVQNNGYSNAQILEKIYEGTENFYNEPKYNPPKKNGLADFYLSLYNGKRGVVGYTNRGRRLININNYYFSGWSKAYMAGNLVHEWLHKTGFSHDSNSTSRRPYSVPYGIGGIVRDLAEDMAGEQSISSAKASSTSSSAEPRFIEH